MPEILPDAYAILRKVFLTACPELAGRPIYEAEHADTIPWASLPVPFGVILIEEMNSTSAWGSDIDVYQVPVQFYYIAEVKGPLGNIRRSLENLRDTIYSWDQSEVQTVQQTAHFSWSSSLHANQILTAKAASQRVGLFRLDFLFGLPFPIP